MKKFLPTSVILVVLFLSSVVRARSPDASPSPSPAPVTMNAKISVGLGWGLCKHSDSPPDIETAFYCDGLMAEPVEVDLELEKKQAQQPDWQYFETVYTTTEAAQGVTTTLELLVAYAKYGSHTTGYIDGRITSALGSSQAVPVYFRMSAEGGLGALNYSSPYGAALALDGNLTGYDFVPIVAIQGIPQ